MIRRLSTKWLLTVLAAVVVPFVCFAWFVSWRLERRESEVVRYYLLSLATELAQEMDEALAQRISDVELLASNPVVSWVLGSVDDTNDATFDAQAITLFNALVERERDGRRIYDLVVLLDPKGRPQLSNDDPRFDPAWVANLMERDWSQAEWFQSALAGGVGLLDQHASDLLRPGNRPEDYNILIACGVPDLARPGRHHGVVFALVNWSHFQDRLNRIPAPSARTGIVTDVYASRYGWMWRADADTIIAHKDPTLYGKSVARDTGLPQLSQAAAAAEAGLYPDYEFRGVKKHAAFRHCKGPGQGGLGWVVGVGVDDKDTYASVVELRRILFASSALALVAVLVLTFLVARRTTEPIRLLEERTRRMAAGDLESRVEVHSKDELGELANSFNRMSAELLESRRQLVKAEKDAAWREMAKQVAHEIKNPLTPISLSATLLKRARDERSPDFDSIFERTIELIQRQVEGMRRIAADFSAFAGTHKQSPERIELPELVREVLDLEAAWAEERGVRMEFRVEALAVLADRDELRRVLINLVSNAIEAMPDGGALRVRARRQDQHMLLEVEDEGVGLSSEARAHLFEPYFTTRTHGTGLGLAICHQLIEGMGGTIELLDAPGGKGTLARITLPCMA